MIVWGWEVVVKRFPLHGLLVGILAVVWTLCFGLSLLHAPSPAAIPSVYITPGGSGAGPVVTALAPEAGGSGLRPGDRLLQLGAASLLGAGRLEYFVRFVEMTGSGVEVSVLYERNGELRRTLLQVDSLAVTRALLPASFSFALVALLLAWRARPTPQVRTLSLALLTTAIYLSANFFGSRMESLTALVVHAGSLTLGAPLYCRALHAFPKDDLPSGPLARIGPWMFGLLGPLHMSRYGFGLPPQIGVPAVVAGVVLYLATLLVIVTLNYERSEPIGRRRIRWVVLGGYLAVVPAIAVGTLASLDSRWTDLYIGSLSALAIAPISLLVSIVRFNLFDVDRVISLTASYNLLLVAAIVIGLLVVPRTGEAISALLEVDPAIGQSLVALPIAALVVLVAPRVRPWIDRFFFTERYALDRGFEALVTEISSSENPGELTQRLGDGLTHLLRPEACVIYARGEHAFRPLFAEGSAVPAALPADSSLAELLEKRSGPIALGNSVRGRRRLRVAEFDHAALEALDVALVAPIYRDARLVAMLWLGPKRSGDVYTPTDARLIGVVVDRVSAELERFDQGQVVREAREMLASLRRYVPGVVADVLSRGADLVSEEREVSVLFVDIRGYTTYVQDLEPDEIFTTVNRYTECVSNLILEHGGSIVEFNGDGMMAVFGAPDSLPRKEAEAVEAARAVVTRVAELPTPRKSDRPLSVGVGVATGMAFVGNIRAADRWIWSVIGNTTNRAARFQSLTREIDAAIVIDEATHDAAAADDFVLHSARIIRGRREKESVYALALATPSQGLHRRRSA
jgi:class 3 adenylate cyclase